MKKLSFMKKVISIATAVIVALAPVSVMAAEATDSGMDMEMKERSVTEYVDWVDKDISLYVSDVDETFHAHLRLLYSYGEGSWSYIERNPEPSLTNMYLENGTVDIGYEITFQSSGTVDFKLEVTANGLIRTVILRVIVDEYGDVSWTIYKQY